MTFQRGQLFVEVIFSTMLITPTAQMFSLRNSVRYTPRFCRRATLHLLNISRLHKFRRHVSISDKWSTDPCAYSAKSFFLRERARVLDIDRLRSLNSAINDCVHRLRGSRSNEYDERVAALGERAVHTDLWLIDWTPFHSTALRYHAPTPAPSISPHE